MSSKIVRWVAVAVAGLLVLLTIVAAVGSRTDVMRRLVVGTLAERIGSDVELQAFSVDLFPSVAIRGESLVIRQRGRQGVPPLVTVAAFDIRGGMIGLLSRPRRFSSVTLDRLEINIPPGGIDTDEAGGGDSGESAEGKEPPTAGESPIRIAWLHTADAILRIIPREAGKAPRVFHIHKLDMESLGVAQRMPFSAELTNPLPKGAIETTGTFGPWQKHNPGATPVSGRYAFADADLSTIKGIGGTLQSTGEFDGRLNRIAVSGKTSTPDFSIDVGGQPVPLETTFEAVVDGMNGDTYLNRVSAKLLETSILAKGAVANVQGTDGKTVTLDVTVDSGRIEDLLRLSVKGEPVLVGPLRLETDFALPTGEGPVIDRLRLDGKFSIERATFADPRVQSKLSDMSQRAQGRDPDASDDDIVSELRTRFRLREATLTLSDLAFAIPGATVTLAGDYGLRSEQLEFDGRLRMQATISEAAGGGVKSFFLKLVDPFFKKRNAGAVLPIKVRGTRSKPEFGLDVGKALTPR